MTRTEILEQVRAMIGRKFLYRDETYIISSVEESRDFYTLKTNNGELKKHKDQMPSFIELLLNNEVDVHLPATTSTVTIEQVRSKRIVKALESKIADQNDKIFAVLDEMIELVKNDPSKIPQAVVINDLVKTRIDASKTEVLASKI